MKKLALFILIFLFVLNNLEAQQNRNKHENFRAYKIAYITQQLDLSPSEAEKFWPLYNEFGTEFYKLKVTGTRDLKRKIIDSGGIETLSDTEASEYISILLNMEGEIVKLKKNFYEKLKNVLSPNKILKLYQSENEFNRKLLSEFRKNKPRNSNN